jgi:hypothetical protein
MGTADETTKSSPTRTSPLPRVFFVTGAGGGLGRALALALKAQAYRVFGTSRRPESRETGTEVPLGIYASLIEPGPIRSEGRDMPLQPKGRSPRTTDPDSVRSTPSAGRSRRGDCPTASARASL